MSLDARLALVRSLPDNVQTYFLEAVRCLEYNLCRAAVVAIWSGFMFLFTQALDEATNKKNGSGDSRHDGSATRWRSDSETLRVAVERKFIRPQEKKELDWYLTVRNCCAHFSNTPPVTLNQALGIADALLQKVASLSEGKSADSPHR